MKAMPVFVSILLAAASSCVAFAQDPQPAPQGQQQPGRLKRQADRPGGRHGRHGGAMLRQFDANMDGKISREEWQSKPESFSRLDQNNDSLLTEDEIKSAAGRAGNRGRLQKMDANNDQQISREEWTGKPEGFSRLDANNDGIITREELRQLRKPR